jgi:hypothetical protein
MRPAAAIFLAAAAATLFALSTTLQTLEARVAPAHDRLRSALLRRLVARRTWQVGAAVGLAAWPLQAGALAFGSVALVQPAFGFGLVALLVLGVHVLGERVGRREYALAVGVLGWEAPASTGRFTDGGTVGVLVWLSVAVVVPYALRSLGFGGGLATSVAAGLGWAWVGLGTALLDDALAGRRWPTALLWALGIAVASWSALLAEMSSLQQWPATRAVPVAFALEMIAPAAATPALTVHGAGPYGGIPFALALVIALSGAALLGGSRSVARAVKPVSAETEVAPVKGDDEQDGAGGEAGSAHQRTHTLEACHDGAEQDRRAGDRGKGEPDLR